jgi:hypothetical protein
MLIFTRNARHFRANGNYASAACRNRAVGHLIVKEYCGE